MRYALALILVAAACGDDAGHKTMVTDSGYRDAAPDGAPPYWEPVAGRVKYWDIQLAPPYDLSASRAMYVLPLWALAPKSTIAYDDGDVNVPAGALAGQIDVMKARRPQPKIICQVGAGSVDLVGDPDAAKFPGYAASPPDDPAKPAAGSVIGWSTTLPAHRRWLDIRPGAARDKVLAIMAKRFAFAKQIGCDGVLPDDIDMFRITRNDGTGGPYSGTGFADSTSPPADLLDIAQEQSYYEAIATALHGEVLSAGMRGAYDVLGGALNTTFDWQIADRCGEFQLCDYVREFLQLHKAVLALDYDTTAEGGPQNVGTTCGAQQASGVLDGIVKNAALTSASWYACADFGQPSGPSEGDGGD